MVSLLCPGGRKRTPLSPLAVDQQQPLPLLTGGGGGLVGEVGGIIECGHSMTTWKYADLFVFTSGAVVFMCGVGAAQAAYLCVMGFEIANFNGTG